MKIVIHRNFKARFKKLGTGERNRFKKCRDLFLKNSFYPLLNNHALHGKYQKYRSINAGGDLRIIYEEIDTNTAHFILIDTHSNLYE